MGVAGRYRKLSKLKKEFRKKGEGMSGTNIEIRKETIESPSEDAPHHSLVGSRRSKRRIRCDIAVTMRPMNTAQERGFADAMVELVAEQVRGRLQNKERSTCMKN